MRYYSPGSNSFYDDPRMVEFSQYVGQEAWNILGGQGYNMNNLSTFFTEMWCQQHYKHSSMEQHVHGQGAQMVGFYFLDCPENCSNVLVHDPRPGKVQIDLPEHNEKEITFASKMINFEPKVGDLFFIPSWLPHSFSRHGNDEVLKFVHINVGVDYSGQIDQNEGYCTNEPIII